MAKTYTSKLKNPKWQKKRLEILNRDNFTCRYCKDTETELQIHHLKYTEVQPHLEPSENLITLCCDCHTLISKAELDCVLFIEKFSDKLYIVKIDGGTILYNDKLVRLYSWGDNSKELQRVYEINNLSTENF